MDVTCTIYDENALDGMSDAELEAAAQKFLEARRALAQGDKLLAAVIAKRASKSSLITKLSNLTDGELLELGLPQSRIDEIRAQAAAVQALRLAGVPSAETVNRVGKTSA